MSRYNFFEVVTVDGYDFPTDPQVTFGFHSTGITFLNRGSYTIEYSFDGETLHGDLNTGDASNGLTFDNRTESNVWFRAIDGYGDVRVESWGHSGR
jgi:hypothetical protein